MKASNVLLLRDILGCKQHFVVPIYQRPYSWRKKQCKRLFEDIMHIAEESGKNSQKTYFMGSIVTVNTHDTAEIPQRTIIDGQQRITTILLLIAVLINEYRVHGGIPKRADELQEYLINKYSEDAYNKYKILLTEQDREAFKYIVDHCNEESKITTENLKSKSIKENFIFFREKVTSKVTSTDNKYKEKIPDFIEHIYSGMRKLAVVDIVLDREHDDAQCIFDSLNSTGLDLSQADRIRNYILMPLDKSQQESIYTLYWKMMDESFAGENKVFDRFIRDYLTAKMQKLPALAKIYEEFKGYFLSKSKDDNDASQNIAKDLHKYHEYFVKMTLGKENDPELKKAFNDIQVLKVDVVYPFLLNIYKDFEEDIITKQEFLKIIKITQSYVFRRFICDIPTSSLNYTFAKLYSSIDHNDYLDSLKISFINIANISAKRRFPDDNELINKLQHKDVYNAKNALWCLVQIENDDKLECIPEGYTLEHVMPQNIDNSGDWKKMLGDDWKNVHAKYLHTIGNLALTKNNSRLSNKSFQDKKTMKNGLNDSPLKINQMFTAYNDWNEESIKDRSARLAEKILKIWQYPQVSEEKLNKYNQEKEDKNSKEYTIEEHHPNIAERGDMHEAFTKINASILGIDTDIEREVRKQYIAYKIDATNLVEIAPRQKKLLLYLNIEYDDIHDPENLCQDASQKGRHGNGDTEVTMTSCNQIAHIIPLIKQALANVQD